MPAPVIAAGAGLLGSALSAGASGKQADSAKSSGKAAADAQKYAADKQLEIAKTMAEAQGKPQEVHQTTEEIQHKSPVEIGATTAQGFDLANQWAQVMAQSQEAGMSNGMFGGMGSGADSMGQWTMQGVEKLSELGDGADKEAEYASYDLQRKAKTAQDLRIKTFGIDNGSGNNSGGVKMSLKDFIAVRRAKDPSVLVAQGKQLADPIGDDEWGEVVSNIPGMTPEAAGSMVPRYQLLDKLANDPQLGGDGLKAMESDPKWKDAIDYWKSQGVINSIGLQDSAQVQAHYGQLSQAKIDARTMSQLTPEMERQLKDEYNALSNQVVDPAKIQTQELGDGVTKTTILNDDGSVSGQFLTGNVKLPNGEVMHNVDHVGGSLDDWESLQEVAGKTKALFKGKKTASVGAFAGSSSKTTTGSKSPAGYDGASLQSGGASGDPSTAMPDLNSIMQQLGPMLEQMGIPPEALSGFFGGGGASSSAPPSSASSGGGNYSESRGGGSRGGGYSSRPRSMSRSRMMHDSGNYYR